VDACGGAPKAAGRSSPATTTTTRLARSCEASASNKVRARIREVVIAIWNVMNTELSKCKIDFAYFIARSSPIFLLRFDLICRQVAQSSSLKLLAPKLPVAAQSPIPDASEVANGRTQVRPCGQRRLLPYASSHGPHEVMGRRPWPGRALAEELGGRRRHGHGREWEEHDPRRRCGRAQPQPPPRAHAGELDAGRCSPQAPTRGSSKIHVPLPNEDRGVARLPTTTMEASEVSMLEVSPRARTCRVSPVAAMELQQQQHRAWRQRRGREGGRGCWAHRGKLIILPVYLTMLVGKVDEMAWRTKKFKVDDTQMRVNFLVAHRSSPLFLMAYR
jgi:hypothetical protein